MRAGPYPEIDELECPVLRLRLQLAECLQQALVGDLAAVGGARCDASGHWVGRYAPVSPRPALDAAANGAQLQRLTPQA